MASGDPVVQFLQVMPLAASFADPTVLTGGSTPAEKVNVWSFDDTSVEYLDFLCQLIGYDGGGLTFRTRWSATATTGDVELGVAIRRFADDAEDLDAAHTYAFNVVDTSPPTAAGEVSYDNITFTDGVDMDSWADTEIAIVRVRRNPAGETTSMVGDANLWSITGEET